MPKSKSKQNLKYLLWLLLIAAVLVAAYLWYSQSEYATQQHAPATATTITDAAFQVDFIDVGQGDGILLRVGDHYALVDSGDTSEQYVVRDYLIKNNIQTLDFMIATHAHDDHIGGGSNVLAAIGCQNVYMPEVPQSLLPTTKVFKNLMNIIANRSVSQKTLGAGDNFTLGEANISVVAPSKNTLETAISSSLNNSSIAILITFGTFDVFLGGDMEKQSEKNALAENRVVSCEVAKLSHHGSNTSNTKEFLAALGASDYIISVGAGNKYNHPSKAVLDRLTGKRVWRTDFHGTIVVTSDGTEYNVTPERTP